MKVTISDVAKLAGVSTATVSHTINNTRYVSNETKEKVYRAIEELGYTPDASARSFRTGKKKIIGFIVPDIANKFFATMIESVEKYLSANGYQLIIANTRENMDREETNIRLLTAGLVDGLLVASTMDDFQRFDALIPAGFPVVLVDRIFETKKYSSVCVSNFQPIYRSVCRLAGKGDQRIGIIGGLIGGLLCIEFGMSGFTGLFFAIAVGLVIAAATGWLYGLLLNRLKGSEMSVTTYVGFSVVSLMCIAWLVLPFKSPIMKWPLGNGLRTTIGLQTSYRHVLNDFLSFEIFGVTIPTGLLLFFAACCLVVWLFMRSKTGIAMSAAGANPRFAAATGINVDRMRIIGTMLSTMLAAVGIIVYGQSYGFMQLYQAPRQMGFLAASAILIGGATTSRAKISNVVIGTFLFQGVLTLGMPVANALVPQSTISETLRILISNGIILYALTKSGGANRG